MANGASNQLAPSGGPSPALGTPLPTVGMPPPRSRAPGMPPPAPGNVNNSALATSLGGGSSPEPPGRALGPFQQAHQDADHAEKLFKRNMQAHEAIDHTRTELDSLMEMGDMVRPEDVIQSAGRLVGHGFGAEQMAMLLSDMPTIGGQGLATWIRMHDVAIRQAEAALTQQTNFLQHRMGVTAVRSLAATTLQQEAEQRQTRGLPGLPMPPQMEGGAPMGMPPGGGGAMIGGGSNAMMPPTGGNGGEASG